MLRKILIKRGTNNVMLKIRNGRVTRKRAMFIMIERFENGFLLRARGSPLPENVIHKYLYLLLL